MYEQTEPSPGLSERRQTRVKPQNGPTMSAHPTLLIALEHTVEAERRASDLRSLGIECEAAPALDAVLASLAERPYLALLVDWDTESGSALLRSTTLHYPDVRVIALVTEEPSTSLAAMRAGAWDVVPKNARERGACRIVPTRARV